MKFSQIEKGKRAERRLEIVLGSGQPPMAILLRPLTGAEAAEVLSAAAEKGGEPGDPLYDLSVMTHTIRVACMDPDSPETARTGTFATADEVLEIPRETITYLYELQHAWQDECSPYQSRLSADELLQKVHEMAISEDAGPFERLRPGTRWICMRTMARLLLNSQTLKSLSGQLADLASAN